MNVSLYQAASAMNADSRWQDMIAENLASSLVPGYRKTDMSFAAVEAGLPVSTPGMASTRYIVPAATPVTSFQQGMLRPTGTSMDFALDGKGFFTVQLPGGERAYTRDGQFSLNAQDQLVTTQGYPVMGSEGPVQFDPNNSAPVTVSSSGDISQGGEVKGRLKLSEFADPHQLTSMGGGCFTANNAKTPAVDATTTTVHQGYLEGANTSPTIEMTNLITCMRMFETNQHVISMQDDRMGKAITELGNPS